MSDFSSGSAVAFDRNWRSRKEAGYNHWCRGAAKNQIQLAFANHFELFSQFLRRDGRWGGRCLEVGSGRGSISSFFAEGGYDCTLLDTSPAALTMAREIFHRNGHAARFVVGNANHLTFPEASFDVVVSIGLLEHFEEIATPLREQFRVLRPGGRCFCYVVPENSDNVQKYFRPVNAVLRAIASRPHVAAGAKAPVFRTAAHSSAYIAALRTLGAADIESTGMYPLPMISPSPDFPFTLMHPAAERALTALYRSVLAVRRRLRTAHPWTCTEQHGQAFLVTFRR